MKLIRLTCDQPSFRPIEFNNHGLTLILGEATSGSSEEGSSNGVGKTLALALIHHCLGANAQARLVSAVPDWIFRLDFVVQNESHYVERRGDGKSILFDGQKIGLTQYKNWLNRHGPFNIDESIPNISFRALFSRFARLNREDCDNPTRTKKEPDFYSLLRSLYLLGADVSLVTNKIKNKIDLDDAKKALKKWEEGDGLSQLFRAGSNPTVRAEWLSREIPRIDADIARFQVAEDYRQIELEAGELTQSLRDFDRRSAVLKYHLSGIQRTLEEQPDISRDDLLELYSGLESAFKPEALKHFKAVEEFHEGLTANRQKYLENERLSLLQELKEIDSSRVGVATERDRKLEQLNGKRALDEFAALAKKLAAYEEEKERLDEYLSFSEKLRKRRQKTKEALVAEDRLAAEYARKKPLQYQNQYFQSLAELFCPDQPSGILLEENERENKIRYDLAVKIEGDDSDGINAARVISFDWTLLMRGANHSMGMVWHDNRLFADIDPGARARWFQFVLRTLPGTGKQYICSLNTENYDAMQEYLNEEGIAGLRKAIRLKLQGDKEANKLLGIQFGSD